MADDVVALRERVARIEERQTAIERWQADFDERRADLFVLAKEFVPVRAIAFGIVGLISTYALLQLLKYFLLAGGLK